MNEFKNPEDLKIGPLLASIGRLHSRWADRMMEQVGLYRGQAILLMILSQQDGQTHSEIAEKLEISPAAATKVIKRMEELNYLQRRPDPRDERLSRVFLQEEGRAVSGQIRANFEQIDQVLVSSLSAQEQAALLQLLFKLYTSLQEHTAATGIA